MISILINIIKVEWLRPKIERCSIIFCHNKAKKANEVSEANEVGEVQKLQKDIVQSEKSYRH
jgi:hypothetical protein